MNFFRESRRGLTSRTGLCSLRRGFKIRGYTQDHISLTGIAPRLAPHQIQPTSAGLRISSAGTSAASPAWREPGLMGPPSVRTAYEPA
jgi:hypothetical protein